MNAAQPGKSSTQPELRNSAIWIISFLGSLLLQSAYFRGDTPPGECGKSVLKNARRSRSRSFNSVVLFLSVSSSRTIIIWRSCNKHCCLSGHVPQKLITTVAPPNDLLVMTGHNGICTNLDFDL